MRGARLALALALLAGALPAQAAVVVVEGASVEAEVHPDGKLVRYAPVFAALGITHAYDPAQRKVRVLRPYDNARFEIVFPEGVVRANGRVIGTVPSAADDRPEEGWLTPNTIAILTGTHAKPFEDGWSFELDKRLRPDANLELWVNGSRVVTPQAPRAFGTTLLVPLRPVVEALGSRLTVSGQVITVTRIQDGIVMTWDAQSGLVTANRRPMGVVASSALVDLGALVLPRDAVAALTGTHISLPPGTNRVEAMLDDRLAAAIVPSASVIERARSEPFAVERARFQVGTLGTNFVDVRARHGLYGGRLLVEAPADGDWLGSLAPEQGTDVNPWKPSWVSLEWQSLLGSSGILGDAVSSRREVDSVDVTRWRGLVYQAAAPGGSVRVVAGSPVATFGAGSGYEPRFEGGVVGARWYSKDGKLEAGIAATQDRPDVQGDRTAANVTHWGDFIVAGARTTTYTDLTVGRTSQAGRATTGPRLTHSLSASLNGWNMGGSLQYVGSAFASRLVTVEGAPRADPADRGSADLYVNGRLGEAFSGGARVFGARTGIEEPAEARSSGGGVQLTYAVGEIGANLTADLSHAKGEVLKGEFAGELRADRLVLTLDKRLSTESQLSARFEETRSRGTLRQDMRLLSMSLGVAPLRWTGPGGQTATLAPYVGAAWSRFETPLSASTQQSLNGSLAATYDSGGALGESWRVSATAGYSASTIRTEAGLQAIDSLLTNAPPPDPTKTYSTNGAYFDLRSHHRLAPWLWLEWGANKVQGSDPALFLVLRGQLDVAPRRPAALPMPNRGQVHGRVFVDANANGRQDEGEEGLGMALVRFAGTPWAVRTDPKGHFTVNNLPQGPYSIVVDPASLSLGMRAAGSEAIHVAVLDQQVTDVAVAVIRAGQIRGRLFDDADGDGVAGPGEDGPTGLTVSVDGTGRSASATTAAFGQFVFDALPFGKYRVSAGGREKEVELTAERPFAVVDLPAPAATEGHLQRGPNGAKRRTAQRDR